MVGFPLLLIPLAIYNIIAFLMPDVRFGEPLFKLVLMSGTEWPVTLSDVLITLGSWVPFLLALFLYDFARAVGIPLDIVAGCGVLTSGVEGRVDLGMAGDVAFLRCSDDHHNVVLYRSVEPGIKRMAFELETPQDLAQARAYVDRKSVV